MGSESTKPDAFKFVWTRMIMAADLTTSVKCLAYVLADFASLDGTKVRPGQETMAKAIGSTERTVRRALTTLAEGGYIELVRKGHFRADMGRGYASEYRLTIPSHRTPVTGSSVDNSDSHWTPVSGDEWPNDVATGQIRPSYRTSETSHRTPVTEPPDTHVHLSTKEQPNLNQSIDQPFGGAPLAAASSPKVTPANDEGLTEPQPVWTEQDQAVYKQCSDYLQALPDHGQDAMEKIRQKAPDEDLKVRVIAAAGIAGFDVEKAMNALEGNAA